MLWATERERNRSVASLYKSRFRGLVLVSSVSYVIIGGMIRYDRFCVFPPEVMLANCLVWFPTGAGLVAC